MKIADLKAGMKDVKLRAKVIEVLKPIEFMVDTESYKRINNFMLKDRSGEIRLVLWGKGDNLEEEDKIEVRNAFVQVISGELQISVTEEGEVKVV